VASCRLLGERFALQSTSFALQSTRPALYPAPVSTLVLLVRHGLTASTGRVLPGRRSGLHLSDAGRRQAEAVAERIARLGKVGAVYASPLERARETATPIGRARRLTVRVERGLSEIDVGAWAGLPLSRVRRKFEWRIVQRRPSGFRFPGGESFTEMQTRVASALARLVERHPGETIVVVSHADPIKAAVAHALGLHLDLFQRIAIAPGSVTAIAYAREAPRVLTVNSVDGDLTWLLAR
jgi:probable phosphoglycerate mutase